MEEYRQIGRRQLNSVRRTDGRIFAMIFFFFINFVIRPYSIRTLFKHWCQNKKLYVDILYPKFGVEIVYGIDPGPNKFQRDTSSTLKFLPE